MSAYRRDFDETKYISFWIKNAELPEKFEKFEIKIAIVYYLDMENFHKHGKVL